MRTANVYVNNVFAGILVEHSIYEYEFTYQDAYVGDPVAPDP